MLGERRTVYRGADRGLQGGQRQLRRRDRHRRETFNGRIGVVQAQKGQKSKENQMG